METSGEDRDLGSEATYYGSEVLCGREKWK